MVEERERHSLTEKTWYDSKTGKQRDRRQIYRQTDIYIDRLYTDRQPHIETDRRTDGQTQSERERDRQTDGQMDGRTDSHRVRERETDKQMDRWTVGQTATYRDRQTD
jgi:hypothetical protein